MKQRTLSKTSTGFTLLELMMVVVIIGILATIALPQYFRSAERARTSEALSYLATLRSAEMRYRAQDPGNAYTDNFDLLDVELPGTLNGWDGGVRNNDDVCLTRNGGENDNATFAMDIESGARCAGNDPAKADWGLPTTAACGSCS